MAGEKELESEWLAKGLESKPDDTAPRLLNIGIKAKCPVADSCNRAKYCPVAKGKAIFEIPLQRSYTTQTVSDFQQKIVVDALVEATKEHASSTFNGLQPTVNVGVVDRQMKRNGMCPTEYNVVRMYKPWIPNLDSNK